MERAWRWMPSGGGSLAFTVEEWEQAPRLSNDGIRQMLLPPVFCGQASDKVTCANGKEAFRHLGLDGNRNRDEQGSR